MFSRLFIGKYVSDLLLVKASLLERDTYYFLTYLNIFKELDKLSFLCLCFLFGNGLQNYNLFCYLQMFFKLFLKNILRAFFVETSLKEQGDKSTTVFETTKCFLKNFSVIFLTVVGLFMQTFKELRGGKSTYIILTCKYVWIIMHSINVLSLIISQLKWRIDSC